MKIAMPTFTRKTILAIDDAPDIRRFITRLFGADYTVRSAPDGRRGLSLIQKIRPDLVLLDVDMPKMSGLEVLLAAKKIFPALRVLMLTADTDIDVVKNALCLGACAYVTKPFQGQEFAQTVSQALAASGEGAEKGDDGRPWRVTA